MSDAESRVNVVPRFEPLVGQSGLHVHDPVEDVQAIIYTDRPVSPSQCSTEQFTFPVDSAVEITLSEIRTNLMLLLYVRDTDGNLIEEINPDERSAAFDAGTYLLEFTGLEMKMYARVRTDGFRVEAAGNAALVDFESRPTVALGARSFHSQPAQTLTTTRDPVDLMKGISLFGNAMKTWSPERTFPSLRGHPPLLELADECRIPDTLSPPDTGIEMTVPAEHAWLYPAVPLAYWLGATVESGPPALYADGRRYPLGTEAGYEAASDREAFERHVQDVLQFTFLLDCAVRTEGFYDVALDARKRVEAADLPLDFGRLYDAPLADRVRCYLELEDTLESLEARLGRPGWRLTADVQPEPERATSMPFLARDMAVVRCPSLSDIERAGDDATNEVADVFARGAAGGGGWTASEGNGVVTRSSSQPDASADSGRRERIIGLPEAESMSQAWLGDGFAIGAAKASTRSYLQRLERHAEGNSRISIDVVVNDDEMADEASVSGIYGMRDYLDFDVDVQRGLTTEELADVFESETDFVHYIGHVEPQGFDCTDGFLDADQLGTVGADTFVLNACASYEQGQRLVDRGAIAGVVTLEDVINSLATKVGKSVAKLLNYGFPIGSATGLIQETIFTGSNYVVVGDSNAALTQSNVAVPSVARVSLRRDGLFHVGVETFASWNFDMGSMYRPFLEGCECNYVVPGKLDTWQVDDDALDEFLDKYMLPVIGCGNLYWSDELTAATLRERLGSSI
jgi:hypothetical protein